MEIRATYGEPIRPETLLPFASGWQQPTAGEVKSVVIKAGLSSDKVAALVGKKGGGRSARRWWSASPSDFVPIAFAEWSILAHEGGYGIIWGSMTRRDG